MKRALFFILLLVVSMSLPMVSNAGNVEKASDGSLRLNEQKYIETDITVMPEAKYNDLWKKAIKTGEAIPMPVKGKMTNDNPEMIGLFHQKETKVAEKAVVFDPENKKVRVENDYRLGVATYFNPYFVFWILAVIILIILIVSLFTSKDFRFISSLTFLAFSIVALLAALSAYLAGSLGATLSSFLAGVLSLLPLVYLSTRKKNTALLAIKLVVLMVMSVSFMYQLWWFY